MRCAQRVIYQLVALANRCAAVRPTNDAHQKRTSKKKTPSSLLQFAHFARVQRRRRFGRLQSRLQFKMYNSKKSK